MNTLTRRRTIAFLATGAGLLLPGCAAAQGRPMHVYRDAGCGCCHVWAEQARAGGFAVTVSDEADMGALKQRLGVPLDIASCHTATIGDCVVEGHVPIADVERLLRERPRTILGLAVPGMPAGSPGMEMPDGRRDAFDVIAIHTDGRRETYARYAARVGGA